MADITTDDSDGPVGATDRWAALHTLLAECLKEPTEIFVTEVEEGRLQAELAELDEVLALDLSDPEPPVPEGRGALEEAYLSLFEAMAQPYAPPVESPYKPWHGDRDGGLLGGPPATDMERRYQALGAEPPAGYPVDHVALLLEYGALLLEAEQTEEYRAFLLDHLDWIPALEAQVGNAKAAAPFYRWTVEVLCASLATLRTRFDVPDPSQAAVDEMVERVQNRKPPEEKDRGFQP